MRTYLRSKIHKARVTAADLNYIGSITIDVDLMERADIAEWEKVLVVDNTNGNRLETYVIPGERGSGTILLQGIQGERAFSWLIVEATGEGTLTVSTPAAGLTVFTICTPIDKL